MGSEDFQHGRVLSAAQDLVYGCSGGKHCTPEHVGLVYIEDHEFG